MGSRLTTASSYISIQLIRHLHPSRAVQMRLRSISSHARRIVLQQKDASKLNTSNRKQNRPSTTLFSLDSLSLDLPSLQMRR